MISRRHDKLVRIRLIAKCVVQKDRIACEHLSIGKRQALEFVAVSCRPVKDWRIEHVLHVVLRLGIDAANELWQTLAVLCATVGAWVREEDAFVRGARNHYFEVLMEIAVTEELGWEIGCENAVDYGAVVEVAVFNIECLVDVRGYERLRRKLSGFFESADAQYVEEFLEGSFLVAMAGVEYVCAGLNYGLLEWSGTIEPTVSGDLVDYAATTSGQALDCDAVLVSAKEMDVVLDPFESETLVIQCGLRCGLGLDCRTSEPAECTELGV